MRKFQSLNVVDFQIEILNSRTIRSNYFSICRICFALNIKFFSFESFIFE